MRALIPACAGSLTLAASAQAAPFAPMPTGIELGAGPLIELARDGYGRGWHRDHWRDQWSDWHWGHCIPDGDPQDAWTAGWSHPYRDWRGPSGSWGNT